MFIQEGLLDLLASALLSIISSQGSASLEPKAKALQILLIFCQVLQSDSYCMSCQYSMFAKPSEPEHWSHVSRMPLSFSSVLIHPKGLLYSCKLLDISIILKVIKHLSMNSTLLDVLQNSNVIEISAQILDRAMDSQDTVHF